jgi:hypothetical protein
VRAGALGVNVHTGGMRGGKIFVLCDGDANETMEHLLMECRAHERERQSVMEAILNEVGELNDIVADRYITSLLCNIISRYLELI